MTMTLRRGLCCLLLLAAVPALAQEPAAPEAAPAETSMGGYERMAIEKVGLMLGDLAGRIDKMSGGVRIKLISGDPARQDLPIKADSMTFTYAEGDTQPSKIVLQGGVDIQHPTAAVTAEKAIWDFKKGELTFSGNPIMRSERVKEMRGSEMTLNFEKNTFQVSNVSIDQFDLKQPGGASPGAGGAPAANGPRMTEASISDWPAFIEALKTAAAAPGASPGKQLVSKCDPQLQAALKSMPTATVVENKGQVVKAINAMLTKPGLYNREAWAATTLNDEVNALLAKGGLTRDEQVRQNWLLLAAAFPGLITTP